MSAVVLCFAFVLASWIVRKLTGKTWGRAMLWTGGVALALFLLIGAVVIPLIDWFGIADTIR